MNDIVFLLESVVGKIQQVFLDKAVFYEFAAIVFSLMLAVAVAQIIKRPLKSLRARIGRNTFWQRMMVFCLSIVNDSVFSLLGAGIIATVSLLLPVAGVVPTLGKFFLIEFSYSLLLAWAVLAVLLTISAGIFGKSAFKGGVKRFVKFAFWILALLQIFGVLSVFVDFLKRHSLPLGNESVTLWTAFVGLVTVLVTIALAYWVANQMERAIMSNQTLEPNLRVVVSRLARISLVTVAVLMALSSVGIDLTILSFFGGAMGVGIGFGMQKIASNYVSGFIILFERSVKIGDYVSLSNFTGVITKINTRYSVIRNNAGEEMLVPNQDFVTQPIKNLSYTDRASVVTVDTCCSYESDARRATEIMKEIAREQPRVSKTREPWSIVTEWAASSVNIRTGFWVDDPENGTGSLKSNIMCEALKRFAQADIDVPYEKRDVNLSGTVKIEK